jgi:hypothetical protein
MDIYKRSSKIEENEFRTHFEPEFTYGVGIPCA